MRCICEAVGSCLSDGGHSQLGFSDLCVWPGELALDDDTASGEFLYFNLRPIEKSGAPTKRIWYLKSGCELLRLFLITATVTVFVQMVWLWCQISMITPENSLAAGTAVAGAAFGVLWAVLLEAIVFWNGMIRVYLTSVQLGLKHRVLAALCGWIPILNIWYLRKIIRITADEAEFETEKWELDTARAESEICKTKYPILLVHGVFFRDFRYVNYWGRIPKELQRNGATVYYGQQQSAAAVEDSGRELADRIRQILAETGCEKVNIIAHSKGDWTAGPPSPTLDVPPVWPASPPSTRPTGAASLPNIC
ncbi:esterase/lipase family protein [Dysosmobacter welbionis]|uniref:esterase/lipase family protein n=1 Tax=Dysosmobacter welbionis TaxID=2093857 RepID=UPI00267C33A0